MTITSPISGVVQRRLKGPGDKVIRGMDDPYSSHIAHLYSPAELQVRVDVPLADASQVFIGQRCEVIVEVLPDRTFQGEVQIVFHEADLQKNTLQVKVRVIDPDPMLRPEMLTRVKFFPGMTNAKQSSASSPTVRVPLDSIDRSMGTERVWVVADRKHGRGILRPIEVGLIDEDDGWVTVDGDLQPGAMIARDPSGCSLGERVRFTVSMGGAS